MKPFLQGKKSLDVAPLRLPPGFGPAPKPVAGGPRLPANNADACAPSHATVETIKEGDKVIRLVVTCICGERVEIDCVYPVGQ